MNVFSSILSQGIVFVVDASDELWKFSSEMKNFRQSQQIETLSTMEKPKVSQHI